MLSDATPSTQRPKAYGPFYVRSFVSLMMIGFLVLFTLSGAALFVAPPGQMANTLGWTLVGLSKSQWETVHIAFGLLWIPLSVLHLVFNRRVLVSYLRNRVRRTFVWRRELLAAVLVTTGLGVASVLDLPPVAQLMQWEESFADFWAVRSPDIVAATGSVATLTPAALGGAFSGVAGTGAVFGGGMGRYATVDAETGTTQPVGKEAAARAATVENAVDQQAAGQDADGDDAAGHPGHDAADPVAAVDEGPALSE